MTLLRTGERALHAEGDLRASRQWFDAAYRQAERLGDGRAMAEAALGLGGLWVHEHRSAAAAALVQARQQDALRVVEAGSPLALRLRARLAAEADYRTGGYEAVLARVDEARHSGDPFARAEALSLAHHCLLGPDHATLRRSLAQELIVEAGRTGRRSDLLMGLLWQTVDLFLDDDPHAHRRLGELRALLAVGEHRAVGYVARALSVMLDLRASRFDRAEAGAAECARYGSAAGDLDSAGWYGAQLVAIRWYQGRIAELLPMLSELVHSPTLSAVDHSYVAALAVASAAAGDRRQASGALARIGELAALPRSSTWLVTMYGAVEAAHLLGDADTAAQAYALLEPYARLPMMASLGVACFGSVRHALGVAALTTGDPDAAAVHLRAAVRHNLALGHWPAAALSERHLVLSPVRVLATPTGEPDAGAVSCRRRGRRWELALGTRVAAVDHSVGLSHLAVLLANPGREIPAVELAGPPELAAGASAASAQPILDAAARREYRGRLSDLQAEIEEADVRHDLERAARLRAERDWLVAELAGATGLRGRARQFAGAEERARVAVGKAIRRALDRIAAADPVIGARLRATVHTGLRCSYRPDPAPAPVASGRS